MWLWRDLYPTGYDLRKQPYFLSKYTNFSGPRILPVIKNLTFKTPEKAPLNSYRAFHISCSKHIYKRIFARKFFIQNEIAETGKGTADLSLPFLSRIVVLEIEIGIFSTVSSTGVGSNWDRKNELLMSQPFWDRKQSFSSANGLNYCHWKKTYHEVTGTKNEIPHLATDLRKLICWRHLGSEKEPSCNCPWWDILGPETEPANHVLDEILRPEKEPVIHKWWSSWDRKRDPLSVHDKSFFNRNRNSHLSMKRVLGTGTGTLICPWWSSWDRKWHPSSNHDGDRKRNPSSVHDKSSSLSSLWLLTGEEGWLGACWWWCSLGSARLRNFENLNKKVIISTLSSPSMA